MTNDIAQIAWAAGLFEGEGCISFRGKTGVNLVLGTTDADVLDHFRRVVGVGRVETIKRQRPNHKQGWQWVVGQRDDVRTVIEAFLPWLHDRRSAKAREALERIAQNPGDRRGFGWTHCKKGHPLTGWQQNAKPRGRRVCLVCQRERNRARNTATVR